jgi:hypothetical protein
MIDNQCICNQGFGVNLSCPEHPTRFVPRAYADRLEALRESRTRLVWTLSQLMGSLPQKRDWLDPAIEAEARELLKEFWRVK